MILTMGGTADLIFFTVSVAQFFIVMVLSIPQPPNTSLVIFVTLVKSQLERSRELKYIHLANILLIFVTFEVLKCDKSSDLKLLIFLNIPLILVTLEVFKFDRLKVAT